ncbi:MAG: SDR family oxidoreductase [Actinomycetota bacterium]
MWLARVGMLTRVSVALITGASRGLGLALARALAQRGYSLVVDARGEAALAEAAGELERLTPTIAITGDVTEDRHRRELVDAGARLGCIDALVNNAAILGPSPPPRLADLTIDELRLLYEVNVLAPLRLFQLAAPHLVRAGGCVVNVSSEAAVGAFAEWGGYGSSKAALDQISAVLAVEHPELGVYWVDPGDMNTQMEKEGFPDEDISDRPDPEISVPGFLTLLEQRPPSGRYRAQEMGSRT